VASAAPDLPRRARAGDFREDLFYRLAVVTVRLPGLAERRGDLLAGARAVLKAAGGPASLSPAAQRVLLSHPWRGNWRELENAVRRAALEASSAGAEVVDAAHLSLVDATEPEALLGSAARSGWTLRKLTDAYVRLVLSEAGGNVADAARRLGISRKTLYERLR
jgi:DNA-binding NtrC family response regulator